MNILLAVDGSEYTQRAARYLASNAGALAHKPSLHLLHVRPEFPFPGATTQRGIEQYNREESERALEPAETILRHAGLEFRSSWVVGDGAKCIDDYVKANGIDLVAMGSHGHGALARVVLGSFANRVLAAIDTPVLIVR